MPLTPEDKRTLAAKVGTSPYAIGELVKEHPEKEEWLATAPLAEAVAWCRARLREKPDDIRA